MEGNYFLMEDGGSFTWKLETKYGRKLPPHGRRRIFYLVTRSQIWNGITSSWKTADLLPGNWRPKKEGN
jgi:hypothetical protein